jgi:hypothetical protein
MPIPDHLADWRKTAICTGHSIVTELWPNIPLHRSAPLMDDVDSDRYRLRNASACGRDGDRVVSG